jgi:hypothetical protein
MTADCPDVDVLIALGVALEWEVDGVLEHVASCDGCRAQLRELSELRHVLAEGVAPRAGFADEVMQVLPTEGSSRAWATRFALGLVASCTTAVALAAASSGTGSDRTVVALPLVSLVAGAAAAAWLGRPTRTVASA